jgi:hypothetical protein
VVNYLVTARPVDQYVAPARPVAPRTNSMLELADALASVRPQLRDYLIEKRDEQREEDLKAGREARLKNKMAFKEAVDKGLIEPGQSPWFVKGYEEQSARIAGQDYDVALRNEYASSAVRNSNDPEAYRQWVQDFRSRWMEERGIDSANQHFKDTFLKHLEASEANMASHHAAARQQGIVRETIDATNTEVANMVSAGLANGMDPKALGERVGELLRLKMDEGLHGSDANKAAIDALANLAIQTRDEGVMRVLDHIGTGSGVLGNTAKARNAKLDVMQKIGDMEWQDESRAWMRFQRNQQLVQEQAQRDLWQTLLSGGNVTEVLDTYGPQVPGIYRDAFAAEQFLRSYQEEMTAEEVAQTWQEFDGSYQSITRMIQSGLLRDRSLTTQLSGLADRLQRQAAEDQKPQEILKDILEDDFFKQGMSDIDALFRGEFGAITDPIKKAEAQAAYQRFYLKWALSEEGLKTTDPLERQRKTFDIYKRVADAYNPMNMQPGEGPGSAQEAFGGNTPTGYGPRGGVDPQTFRAFPNLPALNQELQKLKEGQPNMISQWAVSLGYQSQEEIDQFIQQQIQLLSRGQ